MTPTQQEMMSGLARVIQRISSSAPLRYLTSEEVANSSSTIAARYLELADASRHPTSSVNSFRANQSALMVPNTSALGRCGNP